VPLLAVRGTTALRPADRFAVAAGFTGAAWYVTARLLDVITGTTDPARPSPDGKVPLNALWSAPVLAYWVCILAVLGLVAVPALRLFRTRKLGRGALQAAATLALFASGGAVLFGAAVKEAGMSQALTTWSAHEFAPTWVLGTVAVAGGLHAASTSGWFLRITSLLHKPVSRWVSATSLLLGAVGIVLAVYAAKNGLPHEWPSAWWPRIALILAAIAPLAALAYVRIWALGKRG
jgi:hypothetical protein